MDMKKHYDNAAVIPMGRLMVAASYSDTETMHQCLKDLMDINVAPGYRGVGIYPAIHCLQDFASTRYNQNGMEPLENLVIEADSRLKAYMLEPIQDNPKLANLRSLRKDALDGWSNCVEAIAEKGAATTMIDYALATASDKDMPDDLRRHGVYVLRMLVPIAEKHMIYSKVHYPQSAPALQESINEAVAALQACDMEPLGPARHRYAKRAHGAPAPKAFEGLLVN